MLASVLVVGLTIGCFAATRALGFAITYSLLGEANLAYGDAVILAALLASSVHAGSGSLPLALVTGVVAATAVLLLTDVLVMRPMRLGRDPVAPMIATIGLALILRNIASATQGVETHGFPALGSAASAQVAGTSIDVPLAVAAILVLLVALAAAWALRRTEAGLAARAVRLDPVGARLTGINATRVITVLYGLGGAIGGLGGMVVAAHAGEVTVADGFRFTLIAFAAAAFGGGRSLTWAVCGGLVLGMVASVVQFTAGQVWTDAAYLVVLIVALMLRPSGLGRLAASRQV